MAIVVKRDGRKVDFNTKLIYEAVFKAAKSVGNVDYDSHNIAEEIQHKVLSKIKKGEVSVEDIQDFVEKSLMSSKYKEVAKGYISYRGEA